MMHKITRDTHCCHCNSKLTKFDYRYKGKHYCNKCYNSLFRFKICSVCNKRRRIHYALNPPICKFCQVKNQPCIRCKQIDYSYGKITEHGSVCKNCAKYYTDNRKCSVCNSSENPTSIRILLDGSKKLLCQKCYNKTLPACSSCGYRRKPISYTLDKKPLCKICSIEITRSCIMCGGKIPAGKGNICQDCSFKKTLHRKADFIAKSLSNYMAQNFLDYAVWLNKRRGVNFAAVHIQKYQKYFFQIDELSNQLCRIPTYEDLLATFSQVTSKKYLLVHTFLNEKNIIKFDKTIKDKYANLNLIEKYLNRFHKSDYRCTIIHVYYKKLILKFKNKKINLRSVRLSLTTAIKFLEYSDNFEDNTPNMNILEGYLWVYPGQRNSLTEFTNFLKKLFGYNLRINHIPYQKLEKAHEAKELLQQRIIKLLRNPERIKEHEQYFFKILIGYLHDIHIPNNVYINMSNLKRNKQGFFYLRLCKEIFYLPDLFIGDSLSKKQAL